MGVAAVTALSPAGGKCAPVYQNIRYVAIKKNRPIYLMCYSEDAQSMQWYKTAESSNDLWVLDQNTSSYSIKRTNAFINLTLLRATSQDRGVYVCDRKGLQQKEKLHSCGTEIRVMGEWQLPILLPGDAFSPPLPFPPPYETHMVLPHLLLFLCWWDPP